MPKSENIYYTSLRKDYPRTWRIWYRMNKRCNEDLQEAYVEVKVCDEWNILVAEEEGFVNFVDDMGPSERDLEIDRINPMGDYEPDNCRWITRQKNMRNMKQHQSKKGQYAKIAEKNGIRRVTYYQRVRRGWDIIDAATLPADKGTNYKDRLC
jgi:hypothetical protein